MIKNTSDDLVLMNMSDIEHSENEIRLLEHIEKFVTGMSV